MSTIDTQIDPQIDACFRRIAAKIPACDTNMDTTTNTTDDGAEVHHPPITEQGFELLRKSNFPKRHTTRLQNGQLYGQGLATAKHLWPKVASGDCTLLLVGDRGPGKTQIATWLAWQRLEKLGAQSAGIYTKLVDLLGAIRMTWHEGGKSLDTENDILRRYKKNRFLVIDEVSEISGKDWEMQYLVNILDHRYDAMLATVMIANLSPNQVAEQIPASILDRANETGGLVVCDWPSYRSAIPD